MKLTESQLRKIIRESIELMSEAAPRSNPRFKAGLGEPQVGQIWIRKQRSGRGSFSRHKEVEVVGYRGGPRGKEIIVRSLSHPDDRTAVIDIPLVSFLGTYVQDVVTEHFKGNQPLPSDRADMQRFNAWVDAQRSLNRPAGKKASNVIEALRQIDASEFDDDFHHFGLTRLTLEDEVDVTIERFGIDPESPEGDTWREWFARSDGSMDNSILKQLEEEGYVRVS